jgi:hypothetical protein
MRRLVFAALFALAACTQQPAEYPPQVEMNFRNACEAQSPPDGVCACVWERIEAEVPPADLMALELLPINERESDPLAQQIAGYAVACNTALAPAPETEQTPAP